MVMTSELASVKSDRPRRQGSSSVHDTSATPAKVLSRWENVMASSALKSALRYTACMQAVYLKTKLRLHSAGYRRRSVVNSTEIRNVRRSGREATTLSARSFWLSGGGDG